MTYRKSGPLRRISMLAQKSSKASSLGEEPRVAIGQTNSESQTDKTDESGSVCVSMGASHRLHKKRKSQCTRQCVRRGSY